jgi:succinate-acetate transporter protein
MWCSTIATIMVSSMQLGIIDLGEQRNVALIIFPAFVLRLIVGIACIAGRDAIATTLMASFAGSWLADALIYLFGRPGQSAASAVFFFVFAGFVAMMATVARPKPGPRAGSGTHLPPSRSTRLGRCCWKMCAGTPCSQSGD